MAKMTQQEIEAREKRGAAIHEAGHLTVAVAIGQRARASIWKHDGDPELEKTWTGRAGGYGIHPLIAVAGIVAECLDESDDAQEIDEWIDCEIVLPSATDLAHFPPAEKRVEVIAEAIEILKEHKAFFDWAVAELIENHVITDGMADENFPEPRSNRP